MNYEDRIRIATELMSGCPSDEEWGEDERQPWADHQAIADAIVRGDSADEILSMDEMDRWPDTYSWVRLELEC